LLEHLDQNDHPDLAEYSFAFRAIEKTCGITCNFNYPLEVLKILEKKVDRIPILKYKEEDE